MIVLKYLDSRFYRQAPILLLLSDLFEIIAHASWLQAFTSFRSGKAMEAGWVEYVYNNRCACAMYSATIVIFELHICDQAPMLLCESIS